MRVGVPVCGKASRTRTTVPPMGRPVPWTRALGAIMATSAGTVLPLTAAEHGRTAVPPRPRRAAGALVHVVVIIGCPLLSGSRSGRAAGNAGVQLVCAETL